MFVIKCNNGYAKVEHGKLSLTTDISKATQYSYEKAKGYIDNQIKLKDRNKYYVVEHNNKNTNDKNENSGTKKKILDEINCVSVHALDILTPLKSSLMDKMKYYDNVILDIRHYIRDENTRLDAANGYKVFRKLQQIERERSNVKKELQRCSEYIADIISAKNKAQKFEYEKYIPREISDMSRFLNE